jgi:hypothetical protein
MSEPAPSPLTRLVLFIACLAIAGSFIAGVHYFALDFPQQQQIRTPENDISGSTCTNTCNNECANQFDACMTSPDGHSMSGTCAASDFACYEACRKNCACSDCREVCSANHQTCLNTPGSDPTDCSFNDVTCRAECPC